MVVEEKPQESGDSHDVSFPSFYCGKYNGSGVDDYVPVTLYDLWIFPVLSVISHGSGRVAQNVPM